MNEATQVCIVYKGRNCIMLLNKSYFVNPVLWLMMSDLHILNLFFRPGHREVGGRNGWEERGVYLPR